MLSSMKFGKKKRRRQESLRIYNVFEHDAQKPYEIMRAFTHDAQNLYEFTMCSSMMLGIPYDVIWLLNMMHRIPMNSLCAAVPQTLYY